MKILHIATRHRRGGAERNLLYCMNWELEQGHEIHLAAGAEGFARDLVPPAVRSHVLPELVREVDPPTDARALWRLSRLISTEEYDVVHTHQSKAGVVGRLAARSSRAAVAHTIHMPSFGPGYSRAMSAAFVRSERYCACSTDVIVAVGRDIRDRYVRARVATPDRFQVVRAAIDVAEFTALRQLSSAKRAELRVALGVPAETPVVLSIGALDRRKRHDLILDELAPLVRAGRASLLIAGEGPEHARLVAQAASLGLDGGACFLGHFGPVPDLLGCADLLVHASLIEGVPQVALQARMAAVPVVATETDGLAEAGAEQLVVVPRSGSGLGEAVSAALDSPPGAPAPVEAFDEWIPACVDTQLAQFHARLRSAVADRVPGRRGNLDRRTVADFGHEWSSFDQSPLDTAELTRQFDGYFHVFPWHALPENAVGFDMGCGSGRWAGCVAERVGELHCIDASAAAVAVARSNLAEHPNCNFHVASFDDIPLPDASMDFGYCLGVLHHLPHPRAGLRSCVAKLKPGAPMLVYVYYALDGRPGWYRAIWRTQDIARRVISRLPHPVKLGITTLIALAVYLPLSRTALALECLGLRVEGIPLAPYRHRSLYSMRTDALDRLGTRLEQRFTAEEVRELLHDAGLEAVVLSPRVPYWCAVGRRR